MSIEETKPIKALLYVPFIGLLLLLPWPAAAQSSRTFQQQVFQAMTNLMFVDWGGGSYNLEPGRWITVGGADIGPGAHTKNPSGGTGIPLTPGIYSLTLSGVAYVFNPGTTDGVVSARMALNSPSNVIVEIDNVSVPAGQKVPITLWANKNYQIYSGDNIWVELDLNPNVPMQTDAGTAPAGYPATVATCTLTPMFEE